MLSGHATAEGTARYTTRFSIAESNQFFRSTDGLRVSSIGAGTYLGGMDAQTSSGYVDAIQAALRGGINFVDTALNYRHQRSELDIGKALRDQIDAQALQRDELVVCTKAGYLVPSAVPKSLTKNDVVGGMHSMAPAFLADQLERSRQNLGLETIDVFYLHNPETQLEYLPEAEVYLRFKDAFHTLEEFVSQGKIRYYGAATWEGFRAKQASHRGLSLTRLVRLARTVGGDHHHFRFIQLPFNLAMVEALSEKNEYADGQPINVLDAAARFGVTVIASASLMQAKLSRNLPDAIANLLPGPRTDAQRAIQFTRSTPGISVALVGMSSRPHVEENLGLAQFAPASAEDYMRLFN